MKIGFIGSGKMAQTMARAFIKSETVLPQNLIASDVNSTARDDIKKTGVGVTVSNEEVVQRSNLVVLAVKPQTVVPVLQDVTSHFSGDKLLVSIAAGVKLKLIEKILPQKSRVFRVVPNTPTLVGAGASVLACGGSIEDTDKDIVCQLLQCFGICEVTPEEHLDAVTGLSGSGPAYAYMVIEALSDAGVLMGLPRDLSTTLAAQSLLGASKMVLETGYHTGQLKDNVCSPGGTTIAAVHELEKAAFRASLINAVQTAALKATVISSRIEMGANLNAEQFNSMK